MISPLLANVYLHYVFDLWAQQWRRRDVKGDMVVVCYAADLVAGLAHERTPNMMMNNTLAQLRELRLVGMATAVEEQVCSSASMSLRFEERLALMVDREVHQRADKRHAALLKRARLKYPQACIEDVDASCRWSTGTRGSATRASLTRSSAGCSRAATAWP